MDSLFRRIFPHTRYTCISLIQPGHEFRRKGISHMVIKRSTTNKHANMNHVWESIRCTCKSLAVRSSLYRCMHTSYQLPVSYSSFYFNAKPLCCFLMFELGVRLSQDGLSVRTDGKIPCSAHTSQEPLKLQVQAAVITAHAPSMSCRSGKSFTMYT